MPTNFVHILIRVFRLDERQELPPESQQLLRIDRHHKLRFEDATGIFRECQRVNIKPLRVQYHF